jgi:hypothetical protein
MAFVVSAKRSTDDLQDVGKSFAANTQVGLLVAFRAVSVETGFSGRLLNEYDAQADNDAHADVICSFLVLAGHTADEFEDLKHLTVFEN